MYESFTPTGELQQLTLSSTFPSELVDKVGAPPVMWTIITCPGATSSSSSSSSGTDNITTSSLSSSSSGDSGNSANPSPSSSSSREEDLEVASDVDSADLQVAVVWQNKTPTRLPEALWLSFVPDPEAIDVDSWRMHKLGSWISPQEVGLNGIGAGGMAVL